jgi:hypothetical protein
MTRTAYPIAPGAVTAGGRMPSQTPFDCLCGRVRGTVFEVSPRTVNRVVCYCKHCQAFAQLLKRPDLLNAAGGSDIIQVAAGRMRIEFGKEWVRGLRLTSQGTYRWYACCCNTPIGNMADTGQPAIGMHSAVFAQEPEKLRAMFGKPLGAIHGEDAMGTPPPNSTGLPLVVVLRAAPKVLAWRITRKDRPNPFLSDDRKRTLFPVQIRTSSGGEALGPPR